MAGATPRHLGVAVGYILDHRHFSSFEAYGEHVSRISTHEAVQLSRGRLTVEMDSLDAGEMFLARVRFSGHVLLRSARKPGWYCLALDLSAKRWCGVDLAPGTIRVIAPGRETTAISRAPWESVTIGVRDDALTDREPSLAQLLDSNAQSEDGIITPDSRAAGRFAAWAEAVFSMPAEAHSGADGSLWVTALQERFREHLAALVGHRTDAKKVSSIHRIARYDLAMAALRIVHGHDDERLTVSDLTHRLGVSERAVEYAFACVVGVSPGKYILAERLNRARHHLRIAGVSGASVTTIAFDHNFENLSRFAQHYTRLFGERPSETLRSARNLIHGSPVDGLN
jgi:AraC family transcriptional regulator, ethanolamine operon transcriptional activator